MEQNLKNHKRFSPPFHFFAIPVTLTGIGFSIYAFIQNQDITHALIVLSFVLIVFALLFARFFALKVQNRAIRTDERLRYYILTNKMLPAQIKMRQIIALRFAGDEEFVTLVDKVLAEDLSAKEIKMAIKNWRGDYHRV